jgi:single-stranded DNA-binding protein
MNHCILMGEIVDAPQLRYTSETQTPVTEFTLKIPGIRPEDASVELKTIGWGNLAQEIQERYKPGDRIVVEGRVNINTLDRPEGFREKQAEVTAQRIYPLSDLQSMNLAASAVSPEPASSVAKPAAAAKATAAASTPEPDYDDIPF